MRIYFLHIPKTAGSSVREMLRVNYHDKLCPYWNYDDLASSSENCIEKYDVSAGHFGMSLLNLLDRHPVTFTFLRHPIDRTLSHFMHVKRESNHPYHKYVIDMDISDFLTDPITLPLVYNFQSRYMSFTPTGFDCLSRFPSACSKPGHLSVTWELMSYGMSDMDILDQSLRSLDKINFVGFVEDFDNSMTRLVQLLGIRNYDIPKINVSANTADLANVTSTVRDRILELNQIDMNLYDVAKSRTYGDACIFS
jgi:hypothetical protein